MSNFQKLNILNELHLEVSYVKTHLKTMDDLINKLRVELNKNV